MFLVIRKKEIWGAAALFLCLVGLAAVLWHGQQQTAVFSPVLAERPPQIVVIDPGHGGEDGGAVAVDGSPESAVNLAVSLRLQDVFAFLGQETVMTRSNDISIHSDGAKTLHEKKVSDLSNRVALINGTENAILVSIHQNTMPGVPSVHGAQVFYNTVTGSDVLARTVQECLNETVNPGNSKSYKKIPSTIYLMKNSTVPSILIECGFLSNTEETTRLQTHTYQTRLAITIACGVLRNAAQPAQSIESTE